MITFHDLLSFTNNEDLQWSVGIIGLVILIRIILIPLFVKQIKSQRALTALQPHMKA
jgi:YidC/Oxa1 family membrane protein insertase